MKTNRISFSKFRLIVAMFLLCCLTVIAVSDDKEKGDYEGKACHDCHKELLDEAKLPKLHVPFQRNQCVFCHEQEKETHGRLVRPLRELCLACHKKIVAGSKRLHEPFASGCETCHHPHASKNPNLLLNKSEDLCFKCHDKLKKQLESDTAHEPFADKECQQCHDPHSSAVGERGILTARQPDICFECHDSDDETYEIAHSLYNMSEARCTTCHNPHYSSNSGLLFQFSHEPVKNKKCSLCHKAGTEGISALKIELEELCSMCHSDSMKKFNKHKFRHSPVEEKDCLDCHLPHYSANRKLLVAKGERLCWECHDELKKNAPGMKLHDPFASGDCSDCHDPHSSDSQNLLAKPKIEICIECHDDMEEILEDESAHSAIRFGGCTGCHDPHYSKSNIFLRENGKQLCFSCHNQDRFEKHIFEHFPLTRGECSSCHAPHTSGRKNLLPKKSVSLCAECHSKKCPGIPHPIGVKPSAETKAADEKTPLDEDGNVSCISCHKAHGSAEPFILTMPMDKEQLCTNCHHGPEIKKQEPEHDK